MSNLTHSETLSSRARRATQALQARRILSQAKAHEVVALVAEVEETRELAPFRPRVERVVADLENLVGGGK